MLQKLSGLRKKSDDPSRLFRSGSTAPSQLDPNQSRTSVATTRNASFDATSLRPKSIIEHEGAEPESGPLGLRVVYTPNNGHKADIVFVHGLGGTSKWTWSKNKNPDLFWPLTFLALDPDICLARTITFGYNAAFHKPKDGKTSVLDFAEELLHDLKFSEDSEGNSLNIGAVPLIFVCHSMGGLVVKEACIQGSRRPQYQSIIDAVEAIIFLATPHRGAQVAQLLNRILQSVAISNSKQYVSDLLPTSFTLESQAESFRHIANKFKLMSFYETQPTAMGLKKAKIMLLGKETSVLGYPDEISRAMDADHHGVCKYDSTMDPNYIIVRNQLRVLMRNIMQRPHKTSAPDRQAIQVARSLLGLTELPSTDLFFYRGQWKSGTCQWILEENTYQAWAGAVSSEHHLLWVHGGAAAGKSVLASFVVNALQAAGEAPHYFFLRHAQPRKRSIGMLLRSLAYQIAQHSSVYLQRLLALEAEQLDFDAMDAKSVWDRLFRSILFRIEQTEPSYWVIDGLDEADQPRALLELLAEMASACPMVRILVSSRHTPELIAAFKPLEPETISIDGRLEDIRSYIRREVLFTGSDELKEKIISQLLKRAENNFLFVSLAVAELNSLQNRSYAEVKQAILQFPKGMAALYDRMAQSIAVSSPSDKAMATKVLQALSCANRALTVPEMAQILSEQKDDQEHLTSSILGACCGFVLVTEPDEISVDAVSTVSMIHQTTREYLLEGQGRPFEVDVRDAHAMMFQSCMDCLMNTHDIKTKVKQGQKVPFLDYAASFWPLHLSQMRDSSEHTLMTLRNFLTEQKSNKEWILIWIHYLATTNQLRVLTKASRALSKFATLLVARSPKEGESRQDLELKELIESWAVDLIKISGKFGAVLLRNPRLIYKSIPPFCPRSSCMYQQFGQKQAKNLAVSAPSTMEKWDDSLARMTFGMRTQSTSVNAAGQQIAVLGPAAGKVFVYDSSAFEQPAHGPIDHLERVTKMALNSKGTMVATYGDETTKVWEIATGNCIAVATNVESGLGAYTMIFTDDDRTLMVGFEDSKIRSLDLLQGSPTWTTTASIDEEELPGHFLNAPSNMALSKDGTRVAVAYRGHPLSAWKLRPGQRPKHSGHCWRRGKAGKVRGEVEDLVWHPTHKLVLGVYIDGTVFKWRPAFKHARNKTPRWEPKEIATGASKLAIGRDGQLFATGDPRGAVKIYTTLGFHLLYHLASEDRIGDITFSPDMRRLYDTRGYYASAWEPTALVRWAEQTSASSLDGGSETTSITQPSTVSVNFSQPVDSITVIATPTSRHSIYFVGTVGGGAYLHHMQHGKLATIRQTDGLFGIDKMACSRDGKYVCFTNSVKTLYVVGIEHDDKTLETVPTVKLELSLGDSVPGMILDLLFHGDASHILVQGSSSAHVLSLATLTVEHSVELAANTRWIAHPNDKATLVAISTTGLQVYNWSLEKQHSYDFQPLNAAADADTHLPVIQGTIERVLPSSNGKHIIVQVSSPASHNVHEKTLFHVEVALIPSLKTESAKQNTDPLIRPVIVPQEMTSQIDSALGFVKSNRLVFISKTSSVCYWEIDFGQLSRGQLAVTDVDDLDPLSPPRESSSASLAPKFEVREVFPLPGDWISHDSLMVATLWTKEKAFLCPRNGEIAVVKTPDLRVSKD